MNERARPTGGQMPGTSGHGTHEVDVFEYGAEKDGARQKMDRRLFMELLVYEVPVDLAPAPVIAGLAKSLGEAGAGAVIYEDLANPRGIGVLSWSEDPADLITKVRPVL